MIALVCGICDRLSRDDDRVARKSARPIERRAGRDDHEADVRDEHAAARPVVLVGERPFLAAELALAQSASRAARKNASTRSRTLAFVAARPRPIACSGILSILTGRSGGKRAGITRLNVQTVSEMRIKPMMPMYAGEW